MIDSDLAMLYHVETKRLNEAVKRNIAGFRRIPVSTDRKRNPERMCRNTELFTRN